MNYYRERIIIVDDDVVSLTTGSYILKDFYDVIPVKTASKFFELLEKIKPDLVLLDIEMPEMSGFEVIKKMKAKKEFIDTPVIFLTSKVDESSELEGFDLGAADYIYKPFSPPVLIKRIANQLLIMRQKKDLLDSRARLKDYADNLEEKVWEKTRDMLELQNAVLITIADLVEFRDKLTGGHITRTQAYLKALTDELVRKEIYKDEIDGWDMDFFLASAPLHDVGKIAITDLILNKPGKLEPEEFEVMKTHVTEGVKAIKKIMKYYDYEIPADLVFQTRDIVDMGGLKCSAQLNAKDFTDVLGAGAKFKKVELKLHFSVVNKEILAQGVLSGVMNVQCSRCLKSFDAKFNEEFTQLYPTNEEIIDIMYITRQTLALLENIQNICSAGCKGLCGFCGANRNEVSCACKPQAASPFAVLKDKFKK